MKKILIADVDRNKLLVYVRLLEEAGYKVFYSGYGGDIIPLFEKEKPELIILSSCLNTENGINLIKEIRKNNTSVKIILTSHFDLLKQEALEAGVNDFLTKPIPKKKLLELAKE